MRVWMFLMMLASLVLASACGSKCPTGTYDNGTTCVYQSAYGTGATYNNGYSSGYYPSSGYSNSGYSNGYYGNSSGYYTGY